MNCGAMLLSQCLEQDEKLKWVYIISQLAGTFTLELKHGLRWPVREWSVTGPLQSFYSPTFHEN